MKEKQLSTINESTLSMSRLNKILNILLDEITQMEDFERDQPLTWSVKHMFSCSQISKLIAASRKLDIEIAGIAGAIHDLFLIRTGIFDDHAPKGGPLVIDFLNKFNQTYGEEFGHLSEKEIEIIYQATILHTDKTNYTKDEIVELTKDADALDRFLHGNDIPKHYIPRYEAALIDLKLL